MKRKNKAAKTVNTALGLIVIIAVILFSPIFGYARGFAVPEQQQAAPAAAYESSAPSYGSPAATPRPTAQPTPTPGADTEACPGPAAGPAACAAACTAAVAGGILLGR